MLEEAERRVTRLETAIQDLRRLPAPVVSRETSVKRYFDDLCSALETNIEEARRLLMRGLERIVLPRDESRDLWAEMLGNLAGVLRLDNEDALHAGVGAGSPVRPLTHMVEEETSVA